MQILAINIQEHASNVGFKKKDQDTIREFIAYAEFVLYDSNISSEEAKNKQVLFFKKGLEKLHIIINRGDYVI